MAVIKSLKQLISRRSAPPRDAQEAARAEELAKTIAGLPSLDGPPSKSAAAEDWLQNRRRLRELLAGGDPRRFLEWQVIRNTMFITNTPYVRRELDALKKAADWQSRWRPVLKEDAAGCPSRFRWRLSSSGSLIHYAYHVHAIAPMLGRRVDQFDRIVEFGGGYGGFCRVLWRLGFRGRYVIFDLPEFSALQRYYLQSVGVPLATASRPNGVHCISDAADLAAEAAPGEGLFIGLWSISETPVDFRRNILQAVGGLGHFLIAYQGQFGEVDNVQFFTDWSAGQKRLKWTESPIAHLPGSRYLVGGRRGH
jgi:hypothetical protein